MLSNKERRFNQWVQDFYPFLFRSAWALTGSRQDAEELVQDTYEIAWQSFHQLRDANLARPWLYKILRNEASIPWEDEHSDLLVINGNTVELRIDLLKALQQLSPMHREILVLYYLEDLDYAQVATALDIASGTVMSRLNRARAEIRKLLDHRTDEREPKNEK
jgi:RNA polymerase sigma-70 factor (ECF subfamily)